MIDIAGADRAEIRLDGRSVLVTGASRGIGLATARRRAACGADVALLTCREDVLAQARQSVESTRDLARHPT